MKREIARSNSGFSLASCKFKVNRLVSSAEFRYSYKEPRESSNYTSRSLEKYYLEAVNLGIARSRESCESFGTDCCPLKDFFAISLGLTRYFLSITTTHANYYHSRPRYILLRPSTGNRPKLALYK